jgi:hypothetical protein
MSDKIGLTQVGTGTSGDLLNVSALSLQEFVEKEAVSRMNTVDQFSR